MVASVPELQNRHRGSPNRAARFSATTTASSVGWAKWVPRSILARIAATTAGWAWPTAMTPYPLWRSTYSLPSASQTFEPTPRSIQIGCGREICQLEVTPPASERRARRASSADRACRDRKRASCSAISASSRSRSVRTASARVTMGPPIL